MVLQWLCGRGGSVVLVDDTFFLVVELYSSWTVGDGVQGTNKKTPHPLLPMRVSRGVINSLYGHHYGGEPITCLGRGTMMHHAYWLVQYLFRNDRCECICVWCVCEVTEVCILSVGACVSAVKFDDTHKGRSMHAGTSTLATFSHPRSVPDAMASSQPRTFCQVNWHRICSVLFVMVLNS